MRGLSFHRRHLQRTVWLTLVVWLFALFSGVVNACLLTPPGTERIGVALKAAAGAGSPQERAPAASHHAGHEWQGAPDAQEKHGRGAGTDGCLKFCDAESSALSKSKTSTADLGASLLAVLVRWSPIVLGAPPGTRLSLAQPPARGPPLVIRFLRLTL